MNIRVLAVGVFLGFSLGSSGALAATYTVGPDKSYATIQETLELLEPGDVVEVDGDQTYPGDIWMERSGTADAPITIRGIPVNGRRPVIEGFSTEQWHDMLVLFYADHLVFEGFELIGDGNADRSCVVHKGNAVVVRDIVVHGCGRHGLLGTDDGSGSLTLENSEFYNNGNGTYSHQIYMATDETMFPGSVFRMQNCYVHDAAGGNSVKSRAERNEIYYNWIEGALFHELDLIGPDGQDSSLAREDSDVVGNVLVKHSEWRIARIGGDGTGNTAGRYRFVNNTMVLSDASSTAIGLQQTVESVELHNNVIVRLGGGGGQVWRHSEPEGPEPQLFGSNNWIQEGFTDIPSGLTGTLSGTDPGFVSSADGDYRPSEASPLVDAGAASPSPTGPEFPSPLLLPLRVPPARALGTDVSRSEDGSPDIGAYEFGSGSEPGTGGSGVTNSGGGHSGGTNSSGSTSGGTGLGGTDPGSSTSGGRGATGNGPGVGEGGRGSADRSSGSSDDGGCGCRVPVHRQSGPAAWLAVAVGLLLLRRRQSST